MSVNADELKMVNSGVMTTRRWLLIPIALLCLASAPIAAPWSQAAQEEAPTADTLVRHVRRALGRGALDRARTLATATTAPPEVKAVSLALIELYEGKDAQARTRLTPIVEAGDMGDALLELGLLDMRQGKRDDGRARLAKSVGRSNFAQRPSRNCAIPLKKRHTVSTGWRKHGHTPSLPSSRFRVLPHPKI